MAPLSGKNINSDNHSDTEENQKTPGKGEESGEDDKLNVIIGPIAGTNILDYVRSRSHHPVETVKSNVVLKMIISSFISLKCSSIKKIKSNRENLGIKGRKSYKDEEYEEIEREFKNLEKSLDRREEKIIKLSKIAMGRNKGHPRSVIKMDERKLAEVFHILAKIPPQKEEYLIPKEVKDKNVLMIGEAESIHILNKFDNQLQDTFKTCKIKPRKIKFGV